MHSFTLEDRDTKWVRNGLREIIQINPIYKTNNSKRYVLYLHQLILQIINLVLELRILGVPQVERVLQPRDLQRHLMVRLVQRRVLRAQPPVVSRHFRVKRTHCLL